MDSSNYNFENNEVDSTNYVKVKIFQVNFDVIAVKIN